MAHASLGLWHLDFSSRIAMRLVCHCQNTKHQDFLDYFIIGGAPSNASSFSRLARWLIWQRSWKSARTIWVYAFKFPCFPWSPLADMAMVRSIKDDKTQKESGSGFVVSSYYGIWPYVAVPVSSGNILTSYVMQHCCNGAIVGSPAQPKRLHLHYHVVIQNGFVTPLLLIILISIIFNSILVTKRSEYAIWAIWNSNWGHSKRLFYLHKRPSSLAQYYSKGKAKQRSTTLKTWLPLHTKTSSLCKAKTDHTDTLGPPFWGTCNERGEAKKRKQLLFCQKVTNTIQTTTLAHKKRAFKKALFNVLNITSKHYLLGNHFLT